MKGILTSFFLLLFIVKNYAQQQTIGIKGFVFNESKVPVAGVSILLEDCKRGVAIAFVISNADGSFIIPSVKMDSFCIHFSHINYHSYDLRMSGDKHFVEIVLQVKKSVQLPEVVVKKPPFTKSGDTLKFSVSGYDQTNFRSIGDVIKNIPGFEITPEGEILFVGKAITNYYIEGLDLLEERYKLANENLPKQMVEQVQVLLRHQPLRALDSSLKGSNVALNLKLKENVKDKLINNINTTIGYRKQRMLSNVNVLTVKLGRKSQMLFSGKVNNTGSDLKPEILGFKLGDINNMRNFFIKQDIATVASPTLLPIPQSAYFNNRSGSISYNLLKKTSSYGEIKFSGSLLKQRVQLSSQTYTSIANTNSYFSVVEKNGFVANENVSKNSLQFNYNSPKLFLKSETKLLFFSSKEENRTAGSFTLLQSADLPAYHLSQTINFIKSRKKNLFSGGGLISYMKLPQNLYVLPGVFADVFNSSIPYNSLTQDANQGLLRSYNFLSASRRSSKFQYSLLFSAEWEKNQFDRNVYKDSASVKKEIYEPVSFEWNQSTFVSKPEIKFQSHNIEWLLSAPILYSYNNISLSKYPQKKNQFFLNPNFQFNYKLSQYSSVSSGVRRIAGFLNFMNTIPFPFFKSYRSIFESNVNVLPQEENLSFSSGYQYSNLYSGLLISLQYNYAVLKQNVTPDLFYDGLLEKTLLQSIENKQLKKDITFKISKKIDVIKTDIQFRTTYSYLRFSQLNSGQIIFIVTKQPQFYGEIKLKTIKNIILLISQEERLVFYKYHQNPFKLNGESKITYFALDAFMFKQKLTWSINQKIYQNKGLGNKNQFFQTDIALSYKSGKTDFKLTCSNLLDKKTFAQYQTFGNIQAWSQYGLLGRQILLGYTFTF